MGDIQLRWRWPWRWPWQKRPSEPPPDFEVSVVSGVRLRHHRADACAGPSCPLHRPSVHHMRTWPLKLRNDWGPPFFERCCPHGIGHPDPDSLAWLASIGADSSGVHGCDGCCTAAYQPVS